MKLVNYLRDRLRGSRKKKGPGTTSKRATTGEPNTAQQFVTALLVGHDPSVDYRAPHARRGTPPRQHFDRSAEKADAREEGLKKEQPLKYKNRGERERILAEREANANG